MTGKTTLAKRLAQTTGFRCHNISDILQSHLVNFPHAALTKQVAALLRTGQTVPDDLAAQALKAFVLDPACQTRGLLLVGFPSTLAQVYIYVCVRERERES
jgi:adenylate kinase family enzyme